MKSPGLHHIAEDIFLNLNTNVSLISCNAASKFGITPIHLAAWKGHLGIVDALIVSAENLNSPESRWNTPIHFAAMGEHDKIVDLLKQFTNNPNAQNNNGYTPSQYAKMNDHFNLPILLFRKWNTSNFTMAHMNFANYVKMLLSIIYVNKLIYYYYLNAIKGELTSNLLLGTLLMLKLMIWLKVFLCILLMIVAWLARILL